MNALNRRELLLSGLAVLPLTARGAVPSQVIAASDCLSQESAAGYRPMLRGRENIIVFIGRTGLHSNASLQAAVRNGALLIREYPPCFGPAGRDLYIRYRWPKPVLIREFGTISADPLSAGEPIAFLGCQPVAWRKPLGAGVTVTLASLLGPHLLAQDREALELFSSLLDFQK